jgi:ABC-type lipoprotein release transport system permease subunit
MNLMRLQVWCTRYSLIISTVFLALVFFGSSQTIVAQLRANGSAAENRNAILALHIQAAVDKEQILLEQSISIQAGQTDVAIKQAANNAQLEALLSQIKNQALLSQDERP